MVSSTVHSGLHSSFEPIRPQSRFTVWACCCGQRRVRSSDYTANEGLMRLRARCVSCAAGFEGCFMVPSIYPLETLHNSLSLKQVNEFLTSICKSAGDPHSRTSRGEACWCVQVRSLCSPNVTLFLCAHQALSAMFDPHNQPLVDTYLPQRVLSTSISLRSRSERPPWCEYQQSSSAVTLKTALEFFECFSLRGNRQSFIVIGACNLRFWSHA